MRQIVRDTSAYYLLGYNSTQAPSDGKFHEIKVRVKRPGIQVRARKGYWALTAEDVARALAPRRSSLRRPWTTRWPRSACRRRRTTSIRTWIGTSRGADGKTKVTLVWEPMPRTGRRPRRPERSAGARDGDGRRPRRRAVFPRTCARGGARAGRRALPPASSRVTFEVNPGKVQLRLSVEGAASRCSTSRRARSPFRI